MEVAAVTKAAQSSKRQQSYIAGDKGSLLGSLSSKSFILMDAQTGETILGEAEDTPRQPASTLKVLTGLIAIESLDNTDMVPVSRRAEKMPSSKVYLQKGRQYLANDLINAVLLASANDASVALAEKISGTEIGFAHYMTRRAENFGARNTICKTASGLSADGQQSTARDLAMVFNQAMKNREFADRISLTKTRTNDGKILRNHNKALWTVDGAEGGKTGYTTLARQTYVGKFSRGENEIIVAIMGSETMWRDIKNLVEYGFSRKQADGAKYTRNRPGCSARMMLANINTFGSTDLQVLSDSKKIARL